MLFSTVSQSRILSEAAVQNIGTSRLSSIKKSREPSRRVSPRHSPKTPDTLDSRVFQSLEGDDLDDDQDISGIPPEMKHNGKTLKSTILSRGVVQYSTHFFFSTVQYKFFSVQFSSVQYSCSVQYSICVSISAIAIISGFSSVVSRIFSKI